MHNAIKPNPEDLPSSAQLLKSTVIAAVAAVVILVTIVLPSEYGIDPTRIGGILGLANMGEIKTQLAEEAVADGQVELQSQSGSFDQSSLLNEVAWTDEVSVILTPGEGIEIKLAMDEGAIAEFAWTVEGGVVNYDLHGDGGGQSTTYGRGRAVPGHEGSLTAAFTGNHGWFWRNRDDQDVSVTLFVRGAYSEVIGAN